MPSRRPGPSQTSTQESTTQGDEEQRFAEVRIILMEYLRLFTLLFVTLLLLIFITNISIVVYI